MTSLSALLERLLFSHRRSLVAVFVVISVVLAVFAARARVDTSFTKQLPVDHPYIQIFLKHREQAGGANRVLIALIPKSGDIFQPAFFDVLRKATDDVFFLPGIDRSQVQSLFTPNCRYMEVVEDGFAGGPVVPSGFTPDAAGFETVRANLIKSGKVGQIVAKDFKGALISAQLLDTDPVTRKPISPLDVAAQLEKRLRAVYDGDVASVHIIGFAKIVDDVRNGAVGVVIFFAVSLVVTIALVWLYSASFALTWPPILCSLVSVLWQIGLLSLFGYGLDPFSLLVPFLVFAMAVSHSVQMIRAFRTEVFAGRTREEAARSAFRQLLVPGGVALLSDTVGFLTMLVIKIQSIQELAITASLGVAAIILTNLFLLPVLLSFQPLPDHYRQKIVERRRTTDCFWAGFCRIMDPAPSLLIIALALVFGVASYHFSSKVRIGDSQSGVPEFRSDSRYNRDSRTITESFNIGVDIFTVIAETGPNGCVDYDVLSTLDRLEGRLRALPGVQSVMSVATAAKQVNTAWNEGSLKWRVLPRNPQALAQAVSPIETSTGLLNADGSVLPVFIFLNDHRAETLQSVVDTVTRFSAELKTDKLHLRLASGNAGVMAATNQVVEATQFPIVAWVFGVVTALCFMTFWSWRATVCIILPLALVSWMSYALMALMGIGLKTSTLPVVALGAGIGVDYGIYLFARLRESLDKDEYFEDAMYAAFTQTGSAIVFTALTLAFGVGVWVFSDLKFQADMGILLTFLFAVNMIGAIVLMPALARWLFRHHTKAADR